LLFVCLIFFFRFRNNVFFLAFLFCFATNKKTQVELQEELRAKTNIIKRLKKQQAKLSSISSAKSEQLDRLGSKIRNLLSELQQRTALHDENLEELEELSETVRRIEAEGLSVLQLQLKERNEMWKQRIFKSFEKMITRKMRAVRRVPDGEMR